MQQNCRNENLTDNQEFPVPAGHRDDHLPAVRVRGRRGGHGRQDRGDSPDVHAQLPHLDANAAAGLITHVHLPARRAARRERCARTRAVRAPSSCNLDTGDTASATRPHTPSATDCMNGCLPDAGELPEAFPYNANPTDNEVADLASSAGTPSACRMYHLENHLFAGRWPCTARTPRRAAAASASTRTEARRPEYRPRRAYGHRAPRPGSC